MSWATGLCDDIVWLLSDTRHFSCARKIKFRQNEILYLSFHKYLARDKREVGEEKKDIPISTTIQNKMDDGCEEWKIK